METNKSNIQPDLKSVAQFISGIISGLPSSQQLTIASLLAANRSNSVVPTPWMGLLRSLFPSSGSNSAEDNRKIADGLGLQLLAIALSSGKESVEEIVKIASSLGSASPFAGSPSSISRAAVPLSVVMGRKCLANAKQLSGDPYPGWLQSVLAEEAATYDCALHQNPLGGSPSDFKTLTGGFFSKLGSNIARTFTAAYKNGDLTGAIVDSEVPVSAWTFKAPAEIKGQTITEEGAKL